MPRGTRPARRYNAAPLDLYRAPDSEQIRRPRRGVLHLCSPKVYGSHCLIAPFDRPVRRSLELKIRTKNGRRQTAHRHVRLFNPAAMELSETGSSLSNETVTRGFQVYRGNHCTDRWLNLTIKLNSAVFYSRSTWSMNHGMKIRFQFFPNTVIKVFHGLRVSAEFNSTAVPFCNEFLNLDKSTLLTRG